MVSKETKEIFSEHMIAKTIKSDLARVKASPEMQAFVKGLKFKSEVTKQNDLNLVNMLILKLEQYAEGWITANAMKTGELFRKSEAFDRQVNLATEEVAAFVKELDQLTQKVKS